MTNHLLQSTLFAAVAGLLTLLLRKNHARARYWLWLAASLKFLLPFSVLVDLGSRLSWSTAHVAMHRVTLTIEEIRAPGTQVTLDLGAPTTAPAAHGLEPAILPILWACGCAAVLFFWWLRWRRVTAVARAALPLTEGREFEALRRFQTSLDPAGTGPESAPRAMGLPVVHNIAVRSSGATFEPGIFGIFRPILLLPSGIADRLDGAQLDAIIAHELCHVRRRDNLTAALQMAIEAVFWFHPLVWWLGARLVDERERACDDEVLRLGSEPAAYAEGILKVCRFYLESPLVCVAGITGANLKRRIERIMTHRAAHKLGFARRLLLAMIGVAAVAGPVAVGVINAPRIRAQARTARVEKASFEVASVRPNKPGMRPGLISPAPGGRFTATNVSVMNLLMTAYQVQTYQISNAPSWLETETWDVAVKGGGDAGVDQVRAMLQTLLADRFKLAVRRETRELPVYELVAGKNGPRLQEAKRADGDVDNTVIRMTRGQINAQEVSMQSLAGILSGRLGRPVFDKTLLKGKYSFTLEYTAAESQSDTNGASIFTALQEQLGLKLEPGTGPVEILVIDRVEKPSEN